MKRIIGWTVVVLGIFALGSCILSLTSTFTNLKKVGDEAAVFATAVLPKLAASWSIDDVAASLTTDYEKKLRAQTDPFASYKILGALSAPQPCTTSKTSSNNGNVSAVVNCVETFANGGATVSFAMVLTGQGWRINDMVVALK